MSEHTRELTPTPRGPVCCVHVHDAAAYRVGYPPTPWEWTPWVCATDGRFTGRWDDPAASMSGWCGQVGSSHHAISGLVL